MADLMLSPCFTVTAIRFQGCFSLNFLSCTIQCHLSRVNIKLPDFPVLKDSKKVSALQKLFMAHKVREKIKKSCSKAASLSQVVGPNS